MPGILLETKKKIGSFRNTRKITKAMELVAASKMKQFQRKAIHSRGFAWELMKVLKDSLRHAHLNPYMQERATGKSLFVMFTSDKGLCGPLNQKLIKGLFNSPLWKETPAEERLLITIGRKSYEFALFNKIPVAKSFLSLKEAMGPMDAMDVIDEILRFWNEEKCKTIHMIAPHYKNAFTYYPILKTYLPFTLENLKTHIGAEPKMKAHLEGEEQHFMLYEPNREKAIDFMVEELLFTVFLQGFFELKASEYSSRMIAMKSATDATDKIIDSLTLTLNKARQQVITTELADLINSAEAINAA